MYDTPQQPHPADTPQENQAGSPGMVELRELYETYLVATDTALLSGSPLPNLPAQIANSPFREQAESGLHLLQLLSRARESVLGPGAPRAGDAVPLERVAHFRLLRELGRGGHGVVYLAVDERLGREVALKVPRPETLVNPELRKRFLREAQAAGQLHHPHLIPVHEVGEEGHLVYIASQYIEGPDLAQWLLDRKTPVPPREAAELVANLADGVEHAHAHGVLHRDIKPSNVLLADDGGCNSPRLTDFGLAKLREVGSDETQTRTGVLLGTPTYMAPELAAGKLREVGPATDVYGLGAVLYEVLTGRPPFRGEHDAHTIHQVVHNEPLNPQRLRPGLSGELAAICLKCLDKRPTQRYASAALLAADLRRYLNGQPTLARPGTTLDRVWKWAKRRPAIAGLSGGLLVALLALAVGSTWYSQRLKNALSREQTVRQSLEQRDAAAQLSLVQQMLEEDRPSDALTRITALAPSWGKTPPHDGAFLARLARAETRRVTAHKGAVLALALAPEGTYCATGGADHKIHFFSVSDGVLQATLDEHTVPVKTLAFRRQDAALATAGDDGNKSQLFVWNSRKGQRSAILEGPNKAVRALAFSPDGEWLAAAGSSQRDGKIGGQVRVWKRVTMGPGADGAWSLVHTWDTETEATGVGFAADNRTMAVGVATENPEAVILWDVVAGQQQGALTIAGYKPLTSMAVSPDGKRLVASRDYDCSMDVWDFTAREKVGYAEANYAGEVEGLSAIAFHPHEDRLATACLRHGEKRNPSSVMIWDTAPHCQLAAVVGTPNGDAMGLAYTADGRTLLVGSEDGTLRWWNVDAHTTARFLDVEATSVAVSHDGRNLIGGRNDVLFSLDLASGEKRIFRSPGSDRAHQGEFGQAAVSNDGCMVVSGGSADGRILLWNAASGEQLAELHAHDHVRSVITSPTAPLAATGGRVDRTIRLWDLHARQEIAHLNAHNDRIRAMAPSPDGQFFVSVSANGETKQWRFADGKLLQSWIEPDGSGLWSVAVAMDSRSIAVGADDGTIRIRDLTTGESLPVTMRHTGADPEPTWLSFSRDGRLLASGCGSSSLIIWDYRTGTPTIQLSCFPSAVDWVGFSPDGKQVYFNLRNGRVGRIALADSTDADTAPPGPQPSGSPKRLAVLRAASSRYKSQQHTAALTLLRELYAADPLASRSFEAQYLERVAKRELFCFRDQSEGLTCFDISEDAKQSACGSQNGEVRFYDMIHGRLGQEVIGGTQPPRSLRFVPLTPWMVSGGGRNEQTELIFWDRKSEQVFERLAGLSHGVRDLAASSDGRWVAVLEDPAGEATQGVTMVDVATKNHHRWTIPLDAGAGLSELSCLEFAPGDGQLGLAGGAAADASSRATVLFVDPASGRELAPRLSLAGPALKRMAFSPVGNRLAAGGADGITHLWEWPGGQLLASLPGAVSCLPTMAFSPDGQTLATGYRVAAEKGYSSHILLWDAHSGQPVACLGRLSEGTLGLAFSPDGKTLVQAGDHRSLRKLDLERADYQVFPAHQGPVRDLGFTPNMSALVTLGEDRRLCRWDSKSLLLQQEIPLAVELPVGAWLVSTDPPEALVATTDKTWLCGEKQAAYRSLPGMAPITSAAAGAQGLIALGHEAGRAELWDLQTERALESWQAGTSPVRAIAQAAGDQGKLAAASGRLVTVWSRHFKMIHDTFKATADVSTLAMDALAHTLAVGQKDGQLLVWDVVQRRRIASAAGHFGPITAIAISADGQTLASASSGDVRLWNVQSGEEIMPLNAPTAEIRCLRFSPEDSLLVAGLEDGTIVVWRAGP